MQEHVELEVSLEIIMAQIAQAIIELEKKQTKENEEKLRKLFDLQNEAYMGNRTAVEHILLGGF